MYRIRCHTLFDITQTGVLNRAKPIEEDIGDWVNRRNTQCNFDTVLQVISLRSQPEVVRVPIGVEMTDTELELFGFLYSNEKINCWKFDFEIQHPSVFDNGITPLGALYKDCEGVPMILCDNQHSMCPKFLVTSPELKNIHFEVL
jgi:hypothetical protein